jgi:hypothetical protein
MRNLSSIQFDDKRKLYDQSAESTECDDLTWAFITQIKQINECDMSLPSI